MGRASPVPARFLPTPPMAGRASEHPQPQPGRQPLAQLGTTRQLGRFDLLGGEDALGRLRMRAHDQPGRDAVQAPPGGDALELAQRILAIAARADHGSVGPAVDAVQRGVIAAVEEVLHHARDRRQVLRGGEHVAVGGQHIVGAGLGSGLEHHRDAGLPARRVGRGRGHLARAAGHGVVDDQQRFHRAGEGCVRLTHAVDCITAASPGRAPATRHRGALGHARGRDQQGQRRPADTAVAGDQPEVIIKTPKTLDYATVA
ncbi:hypothetical protein CBM2592_B80156 [Cupriavidus taiwanensis]|nr:hypothetical protein CBM2592_B80156 [Cupriavidus taiwanensis]SOY73023.1 hypothetical protein CBM2588_B80153 [Cupriavidus taiwanensis]SOY97019.1 hypothetical protein CBM2591_B60156 [Cupriavidus taiwanensis]SOZ66886.1 hypothetical protein CBM2617_B100154 [Cupriavidus taiwanensis]SOZ84125.1 hypothetical protein CBM2618_B100156 [Cupriavidus taiwanensis]